MFDYFETLIQTVEGLIQNGQNDEALIQLERVVANYPDSAKGRYLLGSVLASNGYYDKATTQLLRSLHFAPQSPETCKALARVYAKQNDHAQALSMYQRAFYHDPEDFETFQGLVDHYLATHDVDKAERIAKRWVLVAPQHAHAYLALARVLSAAPGRNPVDILETLETAISLDPSSEDAHDALAQFKWRRGELNQAFTAIQSFITNAKLPSKICLTAASILDSVGQNSDATKLLEDVLNAVPSVEIRQALEHRVNVMPRAAVGSTASACAAGRVVFVSDIPSMREVRMAQALRQVGWGVMLVTRIAPHDSVAKCFDEVALAENVEYAFYAAKRFRPNVYHAFSKFGDTLAESFIKRYGRSSVFDPECFAPGFDRSIATPEVIRQQRFCIEKAGAIVARDLSLQYARDFLDYKIAQPQILFPDYGWSKYCKESPSLEGIHVADFVGNIHDFVRVVPNGGFQSRALLFSNQQIHLHFVVTIEEHERKEAEAFARTVSSGGSFVHLELCASGAEVEQLLRRCHLGIDSICPSAPSNENLVSFSSSLGTRMTHYLEAGLPILMSSKRRFQFHLLDRVGLAIPFDETCADRVGEEVRKYFSVPGKRESFEEGFYKLTGQRNLNRLTRLYQKIRTDN